jgi:lysophospholipase L1-like esterase
VKLCTDGWVAQPLRCMEANLPPELLARAASVPFDFTGRLARVASAMVAGAPVVATVLGGSNSGTTAARKGNWWQLAMLLLKQAHPQSNVTVLDRSTGGSGSAWMELCLSQYVSNPTELVLVEYAINDNPIAPLNSDATRALERLVRRLLALPLRPAVLFVNLFQFGAGGNGGNPFYNTAEHRFNEVAKYYGLPAISLRNALWPALHASKVGFHLAISDFMRDDTHLNSLGQRYAAQVVWGHIRAALAVANTQRVHAPLPTNALPPPMFTGFTLRESTPNALPNVASPSDSCYLGSSLKALVSHPPSQGWNWTIEYSASGAAKPGYVCHGNGH